MKNDFYYYYFSGVWTGHMNIGYMALVTYLIRNMTHLQRLH